MRRIAVGLVLAIGLLGAGASPAAAAPKPVKYRNCAALNKVYRHGVALPKAKDKVRGKTKPVTTFTVNTKVYDLNRHLDADKDRVACEKR